MSRHPVHARCVPGRRGLSIAPALFVGWLVSAASGAYMMTPMSGGSASQTVAPGGTFQLDIMMTSDALDEHKSAIFQVVFSAEGLVYEDYVWSTPYANGTITDDSQPLQSALPQPVGMDSLQGLGHPVSQVDVEMSNVILGSSRFGEGIVASLELSVPVDYEGPESIEISLVPDQIFDGFDEVPTHSESVFTLFIPSPGTVGLMGVGLLAAGRLRRRGF